VKTANIHASCVAIGAKGVLILGDSGAGKSDLALRLMDAGARLVADDRTELYAAKGRLMARAPASIAGLIEVRGLGIVAQPFRKNVGLALAIQLGAPIDLRNRRMPDPAFYLPPKGLGEVEPVPLIILDGRAPSAPAKVRLALAAFAKGLIRQSFNPSEPS
jgi:HPr kinase/phosphorylase